MPLAMFYAGIWLAVTTTWAKALFDRGDLAGGLEAYRKLLAIAHELSAANPANLSYRSDLALGHKRVGAILGKQGDIDKALEHYRQAQELDEAVVAAEPNNLDARYNLSFSIGDTAHFLRMKGDFVNAMEGYRKVVALRELIVAADPANMRAQSSLASAYRRLGAVSADAGYLTSALEFCRKALALREKISAKDPIEVAYANSSLGYVYRKLAADEKTPVAERLAHWRNARSCYQHCLDIVLDLRKRGALREINADTIDATAKEIARCDAEIEKLEGEIGVPADIWKNLYGRRGNEETGNSINGKKISDLHQLPLLLLRPPVVRAGSLANLPISLQVWLPDLGRHHALSQVMIMPMCHPEAALLDLPQQLFRKIQLVVNQHVEINVGQAAVGQ